MRFLSSLFLILFLVACGSRRRQCENSDISSEEVICLKSKLERIESIKTRDLSALRTQMFIRSADPVDSVWIKVLNQIPLPSTIEQNDLINVYFKYNQAIKDYEVTARWMPFDARSETGYVIMNFRNTATGASFQYVNAEKYNNFNTDEVTFSDGFGGYCNEDVYYFEYIGPEAGAGNALLGINTPFQFLDVDFDGKEELLVSDWGQYQGGNHYDVYKIKKDKLVLIDYAPLNQLMTDSKIDTIRKTITLYEQDGAYDAAELVFSKKASLITRTEPLQLKTWSGQAVLDEYMKLRQPLFSLDSIYSYHNDSIYKYRVVKHKLQLTDCVIRKAEKHD